MPTRFDRLLKQADKTIHKVNSVLAIYFVSGGGMTEISVIFESAAEQVVLVGETSVVTERPTAWIRQEELLDIGFPLPKRRDQLLIDGVTYDITEKPTTDGHNQSVCVLEVA